MKLIDLVKTFKEGILFEDFLKNNSLNLNSECIEIYMIDEIDINSELAFFEIENSEGKLIIEDNNTKFINLFDFYYFIDFMEEVKEIVDFDLEKTTQTLIDYANNDA